MTLFEGDIPFDADVPFGGQGVAAPRINTITPEVTDRLTPEVIAAILDSETVVVLRCDIFEHDGRTIWRRDRAILDGNVNIANDRDERRTLDILLDNSDSELNHFPGGFWYDKVIKPYRGVVLSSGRIWERQQGEFVIDDIESPHFPRVVQVTARDYAARLMGDNTFTRALTIAKGQILEEVVRAIALNGGITKVNLPSTDIQIGKDFFYDRDTDRWTAIKELANTHGYDVFFDHVGYLTMTLMPDPATGAEVFTFKTGEPDGSIASFRKRTSGSRIKNSVTVYGTGATNSNVFAEVIVDPSSPVHPDKIGRRNFPYPSAIIEDNERANTLALSFLRVMALEDYEITQDTVCLPFLDANQVVRFEDPEPDLGDPVRFLLTNVDIPLKLGGMSSTAKRISIIQSVPFIPPPPSVPPTEPPGEPPEDVAGLLGQLMGLVGGTHFTQEPDPNKTLIDVSLTKQSGLEWIMFNVDWDWIEWVEGSPNWTKFDQLMTVSKAVGLKVCCVGLGTPPWANGGLQAHDGLFLPDVAHYTRYGQWLAELAARGADAIKVWNEPNNSGFVLPPQTPNAAIYADICKVVYPIIKAEEPTCIVVGGGTAPAGGTNHPVQFLNDFLAVTDAGDALDHWAHHPYMTGEFGPLHRVEWNAMQQTRDIWARLQQDGINKSIWLTEYGSPSGGTVGFHTMADTEERQASRLYEYHLAMLQMETDGVNLGVRFGFCIRDRDAANSDQQEGFMGMWRVDHTEKDAVGVMRAVAQVPRA